VLVKENEYLNLTVKAVTTIFNVEEFQVHKISEGKVEANNQEKMLEMLRETDGKKRKAGSEDVNDFE